MQFDSYIPQFLAHQERHCDNSPGELRQKRMALDNHLVPYFAALPLEDMRQLHTQQYAAFKIRDQAYAPKTVDQHLIILRTYMRFVFETAKAEKKLPPEAQPPTVVRKRPKVAPEENYLTGPEVRALFAAADKHCNPVYRAAILTAYYTGMRVGELLALDWGDVTLDGANPRINIARSYCRVSRAVKATKTGNARHAQLHDDLRATLRKWHEEQGSPKAGRVFDMTYGGAHKAIASIGRAAAIERPVKWHTLRHTFASTLICIGQPIKVVSAMMGHKSVTMTERYFHLDPKREREALAGLAV